MTIEKTDVGAWLVKGDPASWDYRTSIEHAEIKRGDSHLTDWSVGNTYRNDLICRGDPIVLYIGRTTAAIVEIGVVTSNDLRPGERDPMYVLDPSELGRQRLFVAYRAVRLKQPVTRAALKGDAALGGAEVIRASQVHNPSYLTHAEVDALKSHLAKSDLRNAGWSTPSKVTDAH